MIKVFIMVMIIIIVMILVMIMRMIIITKKKNDENYLKLNWRLDGKKRSDRKQPFHLISFSLMSQNTSTEAKYVHLNLGVPTNICMNHAPILRLKKVSNQNLRRFISQKVLRRDVKH